MRPSLLVPGVVLMALSLASTSHAECLRVGADPQLTIDPMVVDALSASHLVTEDFYGIMHVVARYETDGCWAAPTGNFDGQWLSVGVMQWNLGRRSLQPILARFAAKYPDDFSVIRDRLMPNYGARLFDHSCLAEPIELKCQRFLTEQYVGANRDLKPALKRELDQLFNFPVMRQLQVDYFGRSLTRVIDDLQRVFAESSPEAWQVAWAMDLKTQQGRFPTDASIKRIRALRTAMPSERQQKLIGVIDWYRGECTTGNAAISNEDCQYNIDTWTGEITSERVTIPRQEAVHFSYIVSHTAANDDGRYQPDAFQRRATIAFGKGSVHRMRIDFSR